MKSGLVLQNNEANGIVFYAKGDLNGTQGSVNSGIEGLINAGAPALVGSGGGGTWYSGVLFTADGRVFRVHNDDGAITYGYAGQWVDTAHTGDPAVYPGGTYAPNTEFLQDGITSNLDASVPYWQGGGLYTLAHSAPQNTSSIYGIPSPSGSSSHTMSSDILFRVSASNTDGGPDSDFWYISITNNSATPLNGPTTIGSTTEEVDAIIAESGQISGSGTCLEISTPLYVNGVMSTIGAVEVGDVLIGGTFPGMVDASTEGWENWTTTDISGGTRVDATVTYVEHVTSTGYYTVNNVKSTPSHKYFAKDTNGVWGWVRADEMTSSHKAYHKDFGQINVSVSYTNAEYTYAVINVEDVDTYFAGSLHMLHHNVS